MLSNNQISINNLFAFQRALLPLLYLCIFMYEQCMLSTSIGQVKQINQRLWHAKICAHWRKVCIRLIKEFINKLPKFLAFANVHGLMI